MNASSGVGASPRLALATNNGDIGGGEVMLLNIAEALREIGIVPVVITPSSPDELAREAAERGFETVVLSASSRPAYMAALATSRLRHRTVPLWCNGLVPSVATAGLGPRIVHLHVVPTERQRHLLRPACFGAQRVLVPSHDMAAQLPMSTTVVENWTVDLPVLPRRTATTGPLRLGFLGRHSRDKGLDVLLRALAEVPEIDGREVRLVLAGDARFGSDDDAQAITAAAAPVEHRLDRLGWVSREDFFSQIDLAVFPSVARETFGLVAAEAMASGVPFVISDNGALCEVVGPDHPWIARTSDASDLARVMTAALKATGTPQSDASCRAARRRWEEHFSPLAGTRRVAALLRTIDKRKA